MTALSEPLVVATPRLRRARFAVLAHPKVLAGVAILAFFVLLTVIHPLLDATLWAGKNNIYDPQFGFDTSVAHPSAPSAVHWLGTSSTGRDVFSMFAYAARPTLFVALSAAIAIALISLTFGSLAAYQRWLARRVRQPPERRDGPPAGHDRGVHPRHRKAER